MKSMMFLLNIQYKNYKHLVTRTILEFFIVELQKTPPPLVILGTNQISGIPLSTFFSKVSSLSSSIIFRTHVSKPYNGNTMTDPYHCHKYSPEF